MDDLHHISSSEVLSAFVRNREVLTVSELNRAVAQLLDSNFPLFWVSGEISNFTQAASGHWYFTLKDGTSQIRAVMFRGRARLASFVPKVGDRIEVSATLSMYMARGDIQLNVESLRHAGMGNLYEAFLRLKARLEAEGLFRPERKQSLPVFVKTIGVVTSTQAAALRDVMTTLSRRAPYINIILYPTLVQGVDAAEKIAEAITIASSRQECDVLIICRGGGSMEDLWCFNEEIVARAIAACQIPIVSGIGHETDFTIADFAADVRAPTPTGAAELVAKSRDEWLDILMVLMDRMKWSMKRHLQNAMQHTDMLSKRLIRPIESVRRERLRLEALIVRFKAKQQSVLQQKDRLQHLAERLVLSVNKSVQAQHLKIEVLSEKLALLNPQQILNRGYAIMQDCDGQIVRSPAKIPVKERVLVRLAEGSAEIIVDSVQPISI